MKHARSFLLMLSIVVMFAAAPAAADWDSRDEHKMHYPQLPDPNGWDVDVTTGFVADDWQCSWTGPVNDIHFWISAKGDNWGNGIDFIDVRIYDDVAAGTDLDPTVTWSHPGEEKWYSRVEDQLITGGEDVFTIRQPALQGNQGWYTPMGQSYYYPDDHVNYWQVNIQDIVDPFDQTLDKIYWLEINIVPNLLTAEQEEEEMLPPLFGWKTSLEHWNDDAVYDANNAFDWQELWDPLEPTQSLDLAFVITPEPATMALLAAGGAALILRRKKHRK